MSEQKDGSYPRVNGGMIQTQQYTGMIVSVVGKMIGQDTLETADGTKIALSCEYLQDPLVVNPDMPVEIIGNVVDATSVTAFVARELSTDMDLNLYNQMITIQQSQKFAQYFSETVMGATN